MKKDNIFLNGIFHENPILVSMLGLCPALAITTSVANAFGMGLAIIFVLVLSSFFISLFRKIIPHEIRVPTFIIIIATFVAIIEMILAAYFPLLNANLNIFVPLIGVNCIILGRAEVFAYRNPPIPSLIDAFGIAIGYTGVLVAIATIREFLGNGTITIWENISLDLKNLFSKSHSDFFSSFFLSPAGAYIILGMFFGLIGVLRISKKGENK